MNIDTQEQSQKGEINLKIRESTIFALLSLLLYKIILDLSYYFVICQVFGYMRFELNLNVLKLVESYFLLFIIFIFVPKSLKKLSTILIWLLILLSYIPMLTIFAFKNEARIFMYAVTLFWIVVSLFLHIPKVSLPSLKQAKIIRYSIFICLSGIVFIIIFKYFGFSFLLDLTKVYKIRAKYVEMKIPFTGYLFNWAAYIVNPIFFALFLTKRRWIPAVLIAFLQLLLFSSTGNKTYLFAIPFVLVLIWVITRKNPFAYVAMGLIGIILLGMISYWLVGDVWISSLFTRRILLTPALLSFLYYDFFSQNNYVFLSHSIFRFFLYYPYHLDPPHLIGEVYFNSPQTNANTGIVGDAYMNFGFVGLALWGILLIIILKIIDSFSRNKSMKITVASVSMPAITLTNSALLTNLLTHGLLLALVLLYLLPRQK